MRAGTDRQQIVELATRDQDRPPAGYPQALQGTYPLLRQPVIRLPGVVGVEKGDVVAVGVGERCIAHGKRPLSFW